MSGREWVVVWVGRHRRAGWEEICARYRKRISRVMPVRELPLRVRSKEEGEPRLRAEAEAIKAALPEPVLLVALERRGKSMSSERLAAQLGRWRREWPHPIAFVLGSDLGLHSSVLEAARRVLSLGPMTFSHELARVMLYEQLYRVSSIEAGTRYHRASN